jgi:hypothetical protein
VVPPHLSTGNRHHLFLAFTDSIPHEALWERVVTQGIPVAALLATTGILLHYQINAFVFRVDQQALMRCVGFLQRKERTLWHEVKDAEVVIERDEGHNLIAETLVLYCHNGSTVSANLSDLTHQECELEFVRRQTVTQTQTAVSEALPS